MSFSTQVRVRFNHCDPAGIVFYPRYFEMLNASVEDWFASFGRDFRSLHIERRIGTPTVKIETVFNAPSWLWDDLTITLTPTKVGASSCVISFAITCTGERRVAGNFTLVCISLESHRSMPWPDDIRSGLLAALDPGQTAITG